MTCTNCPHLQAEIIRLQLEIAVLARIIGAARGECVRLAAEAAQPMPKGVAPVHWAGEKAKRVAKEEAARRVLERLKG